VESRFEGRSRRGIGIVVVAVAFALQSLAPLPGQAAEPSGGRIGIGLETGALRLARNDARIPGDTGTEFDVTTLTGEDAGAFVRVDAHWRIDARHGLRVVLAPLEVSGTGRLARETRFAGASFAPGEAEGTYRFDAYKLTYRYTFPERGRWRWGVGFTALVRDAKIELAQGGTSAKDENVGFVPALHVSGEYGPSERWTFGFDFDGLAGGPGRLLDLALKLHYDLGGNWHVGGGYRTLEGGADTDEVFNFAWLNYAVLDIRYRL